MEKFDPTEEVQKAIDEWRCQSAHHLSFKDEEAWVEIQKEKHAKTLVGRVEKKITEVKAVTKNVTVGVWQGAKDLVKAGWGKVIGIWQDNRATIINGAIVVSLIGIGILAIYSIPWSSSSKNITNPDQRELVADRSAALTIADLENFPHLVKIERFFDGQFIIEFLTEDNSCVALKFEPITYGYLKIWKEKDPRVMYTLWKIENENTRKMLSEKK